MDFNDWKARFGAQLDQAECAVMDELDMHNCTEQDWDKLREIKGVIGEKWWLYAMLGIIRHRQLRVVED